MASENEPGKSWFKKISFGLSATSALTIVFLCLAAMTGAYIWGVITGREMERPTAQTTLDEPAAPPAPELVPDKILQAHELGFTQALRDEARKPKNEPQPGTPSLPAEINQAPASGQDQAAPDSTSPELPKSVEKDDNSIYDFIFQVAALRDAAAADNLRQSLEGEGLRTRLEQNGKLYLVLVLMRGSNGRVTELGEIGRKLRLGEPLLRSKKPVQQQASPRPEAIQQSKEN